MRNMPTTVWCKSGGLTLVIKLSFYSDFDIRFVQDFEFDVPARFWSCIADVVEEQIGEQWSHATWKPNAFTRMLDSETYVHAIWKGGINNDDMKDTTNDI